MSIDPEFVDLTADVLKLFFIKYICKNERPAYDAACKDESGPLNHRTHSWRISK